LPLDTETVLKSVRKTGRLLIADENLGLEPCLPISRRLKVMPDITLKPPTNDQS
jgi:hypothetical protein